MHPRTLFVAQAMLAAYKIAHQFPEVLETCVAQGGVLDNYWGAAVHDFIEAFCQNLSPSTQDIEGQNNTVKQIKTHAPNISYVQMNARSVNKATVSSETIATSDACAARCMQFHHDAIQTLSSPERLAVLEGPYLRDLPVPLPGPAAANTENAEGQAAHGVQAGDVEYYIPIADGHVEDRPGPTQAPPAPEPGQIVIRRDGAANENGDDVPDVDVLRREEWLKTNRCAVECANTFRRKNVQTTVSCAWEFVLRKRSSTQPVDTFVFLVPFIYGKQPWLIRCKIVGDRKAGQQEDLHICRPLSAEPFLDWAVEFHDRMRAGHPEDHSELDIWVYKRHLDWCYDSLAKANVSKARPSRPTSKWSVLCKCDMRQRRAQAAKRRAEAKAKAQAKAAANAAQEDGEGHHCQHVLADGPDGCERDELESVDDADEPDDFAWHGEMRLSDS